MAKLKCPKCSYVNPDGQTACVKCHAPLPRIHIEAQQRPGAQKTPGQPHPPEIQFRQGQVVAQRYTVLRLIGRGGMGAIYKVHDNILGEEVALKTLLPQFARDKLVVERFFNEARIARRLAHPNIVRVHDIGSTGKVIYISMEFVAGNSLRHAMEQLQHGARMPLLQTLIIMDELCDALEYAHQYTIHRDIKPENVMIDQSGRIKLMDFGISKLMADTRLTGASVVMGTPFYMAPEQLRNSRDVDARADIYSVGIMLYEILTGNVPTGVPKPLSEVLTGVPKQLDSIVRRCIEPEPNERFDSVSQLRTALAEIRESIDQGSKVSRWRPRTSTITSASAPGRKILGVLLAVLIVGASAFGLYRAEIHRRNAQAATTARAGLHDMASSSGFDALAVLVEEAKDIAEKRSKDGTSAMQSARDAGGRMWDAALEAAETDPERAASFGRFALQCYLALSMWPEDMAFVPPGKTTVDGKERFVGPFFIDNTEVTAGAFARFCEKVDDGWPLPLPEDHPEEFPVTRVTYYDAQAYAAWRSSTGVPCRLPTEEQWARAAYGNAIQDFPWGDDWAAGAAKTKDVGEDGKPAEVGAHDRDQTAAGCYDMAGNVSEWTRSFYNAEQAEAFAAGPNFGARMVVRGGNFNQEPIPLKSRYYEHYGQRRADLGFRCIREIPHTPEAVHTHLRRPL